MLAWNARRGKEMATKSTRVEYVPSTPNPPGCVCLWNAALVGAHEVECLMAANNPVWVMPSRIGYEPEEAGK